MFIVPGAGFPVLPAQLTRFIPAPVRYWRASTLARRQFIELNLHHTDADNGHADLRIRGRTYVENPRRPGHFQPIDDAVWEGIVERFHTQVRNGECCRDSRRASRNARELASFNVQPTHERNDIWPPVGHVVCNGN